MRSLADKAEKEDRDLTSEEQEQLDKFTDDFEEYGKRAQRAEVMFKQEQEVKDSLFQPIEQRVGIEDEGAATFKEFRQRQTGPPIQDEPEFRNAFSCQPSQPMVRENACHVW